jgi:hypothetical protein
MTKQPEALRLADEVEDLPVYSEKDGLTFDNVAIELRRLHEVNADLLKTLGHIVDANYLAWDAPYNTAESFHDWVRSRSQSAIAKATRETE